LVTLLRSKLELRLCDFLVAPYVVNELREALNPLPVFGASWHIGYIACLLAELGIQIVHESIRYTSVFFKLPDACFALRGLGLESGYLLFSRGLHTDKLSLKRVKFSLAILE